MIELFDFLICFRKLFACCLQSKDTKTNKEYEYQFDQITNNYAIRFRNACKVAGTFEVTAYYNYLEMTCTSSKYLTVVAPKFSLEQSKLKMVVDSIIEMSTVVKTSIRNAEQVPFYNLVLYTSQGVETIYDPNAKFTCKMTGSGVSLDLEVTKKPDYVQFSYKTDDREIFQGLKKGDYTLIVTASYTGEDADTETQNYPLYLYGDGNEPSRL